MSKTSPRKPPRSLPAVSSVSSQQTSRQLFEGSVALQVSLDAAELPAGSDRSIESFYVGARPRKKQKRCEVSSHRSKRRETAICLCSCRTSDAILSRSYSRRARRPSSRTMRYGSKQEASHGDGAFALSGSSCAFSTKSTGTGPSDCSSTITQLSDRSVRAKRRHLDYPRPRSRSNSLFTYTHRPLTSSSSVPRSMHVVQTS